MKSIYFLQGKYWGGKQQTGILHRILLTASKLRTSNISLLLGMTADCTKTRFWQNISSDPDSIHQIEALVYHRLITSRQLIWSAIKKADDLLIFGLYHRNDHQIWWTADQAYAKYWMCWSKITDDEKGIFNVTSQSNPKQSYNVSFGDSIRMPHCDCKNWSKTFLPCKHFFAIFKSFPKWQWSKLSQKYTRTDTESTTALSH